MNRPLWLAVIVIGGLIPPLSDHGPPILGCLDRDESAPRPLWGHSRAFAQEASQKEAFDAAKELGTVEAWNAFLKSYPTGFYANLARAYLVKLPDGAPAPAEPAPPPAVTAPAPPRVTKPPVVPVPDPSPRIATPPPAVKPPAEAVPARLAATMPGKPAISRGAAFMGFPEQFNRYYTAPNWKPAETVYVSPEGGGDGTSADAPMAAPDAFAAAKPGTMIHFLPGAYQGGLEFAKENSGTYDAPIVLFAARKPDGSIGVTMDCTNGERQTCINLEGANYVAVDGFEFVGGKFGVRAIGVGLAASEHSRGIAVLNSFSHDQDHDPFFSGAADWAVWERLVASGAGKGDGHGMYLSNGGDWNIVRFNETFSNDRSDFQINASPNEGCKELGIPVDDPRCDAYAGEGEGSQGASDYFLVEGNYFHHNKGNGANFTSVRRSVIRNNVFGPHGDKHNTSFWQESDNPKLGSSDNKIVHNLFITTQRHGVKFENNSTRNEFANNVILGVTIAGGKVTANPKALLMEVDDTVGDNVYRGNFYSSGTLEGREPNDQETAGTDFSAAWFTNFPTVLNHDANDYTPVVGAPFLGVGTLLPDAPADRNGVARPGSVDLGPINAGGASAPRTPAPIPTPGPAKRSEPAAPAAKAAAPAQAAASPPPGVPRAVTVARATAIPKCTVFVDAASENGKGSAQSPHQTIAAGVTAAPEAAVICVAQGTYGEQLKAGEKGFTLAGGFKSGSGFTVRDSAAYVSMAQGDGTGSFLSIVDPGPKGGQLTAIDGFEITGYSQAIVRAHYEPQRFDLTNNHIHDNTCVDQSLTGAGFNLDNVSGAIRGNVIRNNSCGRGGAGALNDGTNKNSVVIENNLVDGNSGTEPSSSHGGGLYVGSNSLKITGNLFTNNTVTQWGGGIWIGAYTPGNQFVTATLAWNVYRGNKAGNSGGGFFCDDGATCSASHEVYDGNCGSNVLVDGGSEGSGPTTTRFDHITNINALNPQCDGPGIGLWMSTYEAVAPDNHTITNSLFWGNAEGKDLAATCDNKCAPLKLSIDSSMVQIKNVEVGAKINYGANIVAPADPLFVAPDKGDYRLRPGSPAAGKGSQGVDLGAYGKE